jgi:predicted dehydrogenase
MRVAIIGAGRRKNGIGAYIARYFHESGAEITGVLGTTEQSAAAAAAGLVKYGIHARHFTELSSMMSLCSPECVVIASPISTHRAYLEECIAAGVHVFCEKPFVTPDDETAPAWIEDILQRAHDRGLAVAMNSQWPFSLPSYEELCGRLDPAAIRRFSIRLSPQSGGPGMIPDSVPHALSLLYCAAGRGSIEGLDVRGGDASLRIRFDYLTDHTRCETAIDLVQEAEQPRTFSYGFNGRVAVRHIDLHSYTIHLTYGDKILKIADPLGLSVGDFLAAAGSKGEPLLGRRHIVETFSLLRRIYAESLSR